MCAYRSRKLYPPTPTSIGHPTGVVECGVTLKSDHLQNRAGDTGDVSNRMSQMGVHRKHVIT